MHFPTPKDGNSIVNVKIDDDNHLICEMEDGTSIDAGELPTGTGGSAKIQRGSIEFDGENDTFNLPKDNTTYNIYINGMYMTEGFDYTIDTSVKPNQVTFDTIYDETDICTLTYLKSVNGGETGDNDFEIEYATEKDILNLFKEEEDIDGN